MASRVQRANWRSVSGINREKEDSRVGRGRLCSKPQPVRRGGSQKGQAWEKEERGLGQGEEQVPAGTADGKPVAEPGGQSPAGRSRAGG